MSGDLIGDLIVARLFDLVKPLVDGKKSGMVAIDGTDEAELYLEGGAIVHGKTGALAGEEAILAIMDLGRGRVSFDWQLSPEKRTVSTATGELMSNWARREEGWRRIREVMPSSDAVFSIVVDAGEHDRTIPGRQWAVLALCNGMRSVSDIAEVLGRSVFEVSETVCEMVDAGLLQKAEFAGISRTRPKETVDESFFTTTETELKKVMGPIARIIMRDTLAAFGLPRDVFPREQVASFIRTVSAQIGEDQKRDQFAKAIYLAWIPTLENT